MHARIPGGEKGDPSHPVVTVPSDLSHRAHRRLIGFLGLFLPLLVYLFAGVLPTI